MASEWGRGFRLKDTSVVLFSFYTGSHYVDQAVLELTEISLPLGPALLSVLPATGKASFVSTLCACVYFIDGTSVCRSTLVVLSQAPTILFSEISGVPLPFTSEEHITGLILVLGPGPRSPRAKRVFWSHLVLSNEARLPYSLFSKTSCWRSLFLGRRYQFWVGYNPVHWGLQDSQQLGALRVTMLYPPHSPTE